MQSIKIFTDGSCWPNPGGPGGWAAVILCAGERRELKGHIPAPSTNNRAEMRAAIEALSSVPTGSEIDLYTDAQYLQKGATIWIHSWRRRHFRGVKNSDLWLRISELCEAHKVRWHWVAGHADSTENNRCDYLAESMRKQPQLTVSAL